MDIRSLPIPDRRKALEQTLKIDLSILAPREETVGHADEKNCEQMFGSIPVPVGYAGPLAVQFSSDENAELHLPLATTEGALVASVNRGCKAASVESVRMTSINHGISRSIAFRVGKDTQSFTPKFIKELKKRKAEWTTVAEGTSGHLMLLGHDIDEQDGHVFLTLSADTDEAMGMNMVTIAAQAAADAITTNAPDIVCVTVAANVDSDKKPSLRTYERGRGFEVTAETILSNETIENVLKSSVDSMLAVAKAKLEIGSELAGAIGRNLQAANIIAALYLATGQDVAHVVEGSLSDTYVEKADEGLKVTVRCPAIIVGVRGGGTSLPAQSQCLRMMLKPTTKLQPRAQLAESIGATVLTGEISLLAAQASHHLAKAHKKLGRKNAAIN